MDMSMYEDKMWGRKREANKSNEWPVKNEEGEDEAKKKEEEEEEREIVEKHERSNTRRAVQQT